MDARGFHMEPGEPSWKTLHRWSQNRWRNNYLVTRNLRSEPYWSHGVRHWAETRRWLKTHLMDTWGIWSWLTQRSLLRRWMRFLCRVANGSNDHRKSHGNQCGVNNTDHSVFNNLEVDLSKQTTELNSCQFIEWMRILYWTQLQGSF